MLYSFSGLRALHGEIVIPEGGAEMRCLAKAFASKVASKFERTDAGWAISVLRPPLLALQTLRIASGFASSFQIKRFKFTSGFFVF